MAYFDNAATTFPKPQCVYDFMNSFYREHGGSAGRGNHSLSMNAGKLVSETRIRLQQILHCESKHIVFTPSATIALNMILQGTVVELCRNRTQPIVYISPFEHNAVTRILHHFESTGKIKVKILPVQKDFSYNLEEIKFTFEKEKPDLLVISHASNVTGFIQPVENLCQLAKSFNAITVIDMAQTAGLVDLNVGLETVDFAVFAGHKTLYGPTGASGFAMKADFILPPVLFGGTGYESANQDMPLDIPQRYEMGTLNISGIAGLYASTGWILETGLSVLYEKEKKHRKRLLEILGKYDFVKVVGNCHGKSHSERSSAVREESISSDVSALLQRDKSFVGIVSCVIDGIPSDTAASIFAEQNIAVRSGLQCTPLAHRTLGTFPAGTVRFSTGAFTGEADFIELETALEYLKGNL